MGILTDIKTFHLDVIVPCTVQSEANSSTQLVIPFKRNVRTKVQVQSSFHFNRMYLKSYNIVFNKGSFGTSKTAVHPPTATAVLRVSTDNHAVQSIGILVDGTLLLDGIALPLNATSKDVSSDGTFGPSAETTGAHNVVLSPPRLVLDSPSGAPLTQNLTFEFFLATAGLTLSSSSVVEATHVLLSLLIESDCHRHE